MLVADNLFLGEAGEEAERLHDPTHVRNYSEEEWRGMFDARRARGRERSSARTSASTSSRGSTAPGRRARTPRECASCSPTGSRTAAPARPRHLQREEGARWRSSSTTTRGSSSRASPAARARSTRVRNRDYGTNVVAGVTPGKGGQDGRGHPRLRHRRRRRRRDAARTRRSSSSRRASPPTRSTRPSTRASRP